ncbi:hypothetical protein COW36_22705 [bacterium (Candidatus Blackallbacteria) CG17_big_fil_post_rev_8_21_14_2_50_48_46]|uniref:Peptidase M4 domain-containing protein n=1 Tax=bacterium (Candidatus Blackallbacteria) CG17_big_fil_post_rev_8_21_14_2_50_48_46 TaxID=2014261 RepID=A0A2M7FZD2_9BACT|nr:MAG: hypothetical protein COW64_07475 [bacterium (Candidatus Blackallbacteria) CG18_big_fil_WC_8_21_14_2_50_49_26]PIW14190.1 MAG: hypothetical protein COW36_22705 [bacterium (Candidatus Blackallbacteria) CG17_big_fil_post_rev_8_21_14_2_50_48_46]PIW46731.1 MAG: hypothetical protein COW20_14980 [bacterium (Candidatus Blackallbacteria) CG13_big_fil_rev_8_21_14_2_50_49_14]
MLQRIYLATLASALMLAACAPQPQIQPLANSLALRAQSAGHVIDDSDISAPVKVNQIPILEKEAKREGNQLIFRAVSLNRQSPLPLASNRLELVGQFKYYDLQAQLIPAANATVSLYQGSRAVAQAITDAEGHWSLIAPAPGAYQIRYSFANPRWSIERYSWEGPSLQVQNALDTGVYALEKGTKNSEVGLIHEVYNRALRLFSREQMDLSWWKTRIKTIWPGSGDYYSYYTVNLTGAQQWDVNGHEIGHAIYDQALNANSTGGQHKIDECYNGTLAFSEGFATFFSGAVQLERNAQDAHFGSSLVPRRAPIRIENTPSDVCPGNRNEWRVASVIWDLYDTHEDQADHLNLSLKEIFSAFGQANKPAINTALDAYQLLKERVPAASLPMLRSVFEQNTMEVKD